MRYTTRDAMHHSTAAHKVAACARQWPHAQRHLVAYGWCLAPNMAARAATASRDTRIACHMDDACSTSMTARTAAASGCTWMVPCFESTAGLNQRLHSRWRHCVAHGASYRIMCCMACHAVRLGISARFISMTARTAAASRGTWMVPHLISMAARTTAASRGT